MTEYDLAEIMHDKLCPRNHNDVCGWMYENEPSYPGDDKWIYGYAHKEWLGKARRVINITNMKYQDIAKVVNAL